MMNDRFAADLRRHLLENADERPAEGQLAEIQALVATTSQRHALAARLTWSPWRISARQSTAVRYGLVAVALLLTLAVVALLGSGARAPSTVFEGTWMALDLADGSTLNLEVGSGLTPALRFVDFYATGDACVADAVKVFTADGVGEITGTQLVASFPKGGGCGTAFVNVAGVYDHDAGTDTLVDQAGVRWDRVRTLGGPKTAVPVTPDPPTPAPPGEGPATDVPAATAVLPAEPSGTAPAGTDGPRPSATSGTATACVGTSDGTYEAAVGGYLVSAEAQDTWYGTRDGFFLSRTTCGHTEAARIQVSEIAEVDQNACRWADAGIQVETPGEAVAALVAQAGHETVGPTDLTIAGRDASRLDLTLPAGTDVTSCDDGTLAIWAAPVGSVPADLRMRPGETVTMFVVDVDGHAFGVAVVYPSEGGTPDGNSQVVAILSSLRFQPLP